MVTPVNERVKRYRERQRQARPQEPLWHTLIGRLHVADLWLSQGGTAPDSFVDTIKAVAAKLGLKVTEEPPAAEEPPQPKGIPARVSAILEPLTAQLIAELPARSQPKFRRNLDKFLAGLQRGCRDLVGEEIYTELTWWRDRWVANSAFTATCDPDAVHEDAKKNEDVTRTFWDFYRQMKEFKDMLTPHFWQEFRRAFDGLIQLIGETCQINLPVELDRRIKAKEKAKMEYFATRVKDFKKSQVSQGKEVLAEVMTEEEFKLIRGLLHPDKYPAEEHQRRARAFEAFNRLAEMVTPV